MIFKLIDELGLQVYPDHYSSTAREMVFKVNAHELEALLEKAVKVSGVWPANGQFEMHREHYNWATHSALAINIRPIKAKETAEDILRDLVKWTSPKDNASSIQSLCERANKLLRSKKESK